ncbi:MAG: phosphoribosylanthranilate isomerase [Roseitalea sp.]|jgi:phosphoribosylanthranilate isomerase|nr:phosphoribosylanthranilate isomerase [Roseitalea sp.]MBO6721890.1 phosphoribosylanthranilate isomerase [Roseitalea sp.]MBO6743061.1 phosphoribosylanthranilate isomerase [Roseitalea sp.]
MSLDIKICGLSTPETLGAAIAGGASHAGFIFFEKSPRNVTPEEAAPLAARARATGVAAVAVTVDADDDTLDTIVRMVRPDMLQLHGRESPQRIAAIKARHGLPVMKAFAIARRDDLKKLDACRGIADRFLLDAKPPTGSDLPGGNGVSFDWSLLASLDADTDYMLSGGLDAGNVGEALGIANPPGIDVSSGVESAPGIKDTALIEAFFLAVADACEQRKTAALGV